MAYAVRKTRTEKHGPVTETFVESTVVVYAETVAEALEKGALALGVTSTSLLTIDELDDGMSDEQAADAKELYPGQTGDRGMVANITDEMRGASQQAVYGSGKLV